MRIIHYCILNNCYITVWICQKLQTSKFELVTKTKYFLFIYKSYYEYIGLKTEWSRKKEISVDGHGAKIKYFLLNNSAFLN